MSATETYEETHRRLRRRLQAKPEPRYLAIGTKTFDRVDRSGRLLEQAEVDVLVDAKTHRLAGYRWPNGTIDTNVDTYTGGDTTTEERVVVRRRHTDPESTDTVETITVEQSDLDLGERLSPGYTARLMRWAARS